MKKSLSNLNYEKYYKQILPYIKKEQNQKYLFIALTLAASIFFIIFAINPTLSTIIRLRREINDSSFVNEKLTQKVNNLSTLSTSYNEIEDDLTFLLDAIPNKAEAPTLIGQIQALANEHSVTFHSANISPINFSDNGATSSSSFTFELGGLSSYENFYNFISDLTNMQRIVVIEGISISKEIESTSQELNVSIKGSAFYKE